MNPDIPTSSSPSSPGNLDPEFPRHRRSESDANPVEDDDDEEEEEEEEEEEFGTEFFIDEEDFFTVLGVLLVGQRLKATTEPAGASRTTPW